MTRWVYEKTQWRGKSKVEGSVGGRKPLVSVIVPVYNVYPYLRDCVQSVQAQSYQNWELLLVDDGSTDGSGELCDELAVEDGRIRVFHKPNGGSPMPGMLG